MAKKKKRAKRKPSIQKQLDVLCELVNELSEKISKLYLEVNRIRTPNPYQPPAPMPPYGIGPWNPPSPPPYEVTCKKPPEGLMYNSKGRADGRH